MGISITEFSKFSMAGLRAGHPGQQTTVPVALDGRVRPAHGEFLEIWRVHLGDLYHTATLAKRIGRQEAGYRGLHAGEGWPVEIKRRLGWARPMTENSA